MRSRRCRRSWWTTRASRWDASPRIGARAIDILREAGIPPLHYGIAAAGLVFVVPADSGLDALRALHDDLIPPEGDFAGEEVA